jgi:hypothetical protein
MHNILEASLCCMFIHYVFYPTTALMHFLGANHQLVERLVVACSIDRKKDDFNIFQAPLFLHFAQPTLMGRKVIN